MEAFLVTRRDLLKLGGACVATIALGSKLNAANTEPVIGLIFPPFTKPLPEADKMYPNTVKFLMKGLGITAMTAEDYDAAVPKVTNAAKGLRDKGAQGISLMGTSLTFYKGAEFNRYLIQSMHEATGLPCTTMSTGIVDGLQAVKAKRVAVATAYQDDINQRLIVFLNESGFQVDYLKGLGLGLLSEPRKVTEAQLMDLCSDVCRSAPHAEALVISCGGLFTMGIHLALEKQFKVPVVSSTSAALWSVVRMMGMSGRAPGLGRLLEID